MKLPTVYLVPTGPIPDQSYFLPTEREINRTTLLDVALDREELLTSDRSIEELRQLLKLHVVSPEGHWLYRAQKRSQVQLRGATARASVFDLKEPMASQEYFAHVPVKRRRVLSSSLVEPSTELSGIESRLASLDDASVENKWDEIMLSTAEQLISPRPLAPTHILVAYTITPTVVVSPLSRLDQNTTRRPRPTFPEIVELPINDLSLILNAPNLASSTIEGNGIGGPVLPHRLHKKLPRVLIQVPHLETFPEAIIYLHTKNQAELFRKLIPEWMRDIMHPLPAPQVNTVAQGNSNQANGISLAMDGKKVMKLLGMLVPGSTPCYVETTDCRYTSGAYEGRTVNTIAEEIAEAEYLSSDTIKFGSATDPLINTAAMLEALRDNMFHLGYFAKELWDELDTCRDILLRAVTYKARIMHRE
ncbi:hypothetical protein BDQ12DRAFT_739386 [Crucibulum laeve]|uniref:Uncharacterized protein n=1 Tax=Crucibulum laeve TaxID=68775 RepID=A0A5C3LH13_9AGAR|nr:hypothetical protein BDQ12DRAFT_739386 [Crucibulum laeve]